MVSLAAIAPPALFAAFLWWFSTGAILWLDRRPRETFGMSLAAAGMAALGAVALLIYSASRTGAADAYIAFASALAIWGWHEMSFLMGFITGPRRQPLPAGARGWRRFKLAAATVIHHEIALAATALLLAVLAWGQPNQVGVLTFLLLWALRLSAKFNLFLGVPYRGEDMLPPHLAHLGSYFRRRAMNGLFPISLLAGCGLASAIALIGFGANATTFEMTGALLMLTLVALGMIEHVFMFVPPPNVMLWGWALRRPEDVQRMRSRS